MFFRNVDESDQVKHKIYEQVARKKKTDARIEKMMEQLYEIRDKLLSFCVKLEVCSRREPLQVSSSSIIIKGKTKQ